MRRALAVALFVLSFTAVAKDDPNVHEVPGTGVSLTKPDGWTYEVQAPGIIVVQNPADGAAFALIVQSMPTPPAGSAPMILTATAKRLEQKYTDFRIEEPVRKTTIAGQEAAEMTASYTHTKGQTSLRVRSRALVVLRKAGILVVTMSDSPGGDATSHDKLDGILASLKIAK